MSRESIPAVYRKLYLAELVSMRVLLSTIETAMNNNKPVVEIHDLEAALDESGSRSRRIRRLYYEQLYRYGNNS